MAVTGEFPEQKTSNAENITIWLRHRVFYYIYRVRFLMVVSHRAVHVILPGLSESIQSQCMYIMMVSYIVCVEGDSYRRWSQIRHGCYFP